MRSWRRALARTAISSRVTCRCAMRPSSTVDLLAAETRRASQAARPGPQAANGDAENPAE